jgi:hypothetical protein
LIHQVGSAMKGVGYVLRNTAKDSGEFFLDTRDHNIEGYIKGWLIDDPCHSLTTFFVFFPQKRKKKFLPIFSLM